MPNKPPASIRVGSRELTLWTYAQLESIDRANRKRRALDLHTAAGPDLSPQLMSGLPSDELTAWMIELQVTLCGACGVEVSSADFGVPDSAVRFPDEMRPKPFTKWKSYGSTNEEQFLYDEKYAEAAAASAKTAVEARARHRGTVGTFLFSEEGEEPETPSAAYRGLEPPYQVLPEGYRPHTQSGRASISMSDYAPPPAAAYRQHDDQRQ